MIRFFSHHRDPLRGAHLSTCWTVYSKPLAAACAEMRKRVTAGAVAKEPTFFDYGPGDEELRRLDAQPCWAQTAAV
jgi:hypothetical protein